MSKNNTLHLPRHMGEILVADLGLARDQLISFLVIQDRATSKRPLTLGRDTSVLVSRLKAARAEIDDALGYLERE